MVHSTSQHLITRKLDQKDGSFTRVIFDHDDALVLLDNAIRNRETKARPAPTSFVVKKGSKMRCSSPAGMPGPVSRKLISTISADAVQVIEMTFRISLTMASR